MIITGSVALVMMYTGMSFSAPRMRESFSRSDLGSIGWLTFVNYILIPLTTALAVVASIQFTGVGLALLTMAVLPCAPLVPSVVTMLDEPPEWSILVFILFSAISLVFIVLLTVVLATGGYIQQNGDHSNHDVYRGLLGYLVAIFVPLVAGIGFRMFSSSWYRPLLRFLRPVAGTSLLVALVTFVVANYVQVSAVSLTEVLIIIAFNLCCIALVFPFRSITCDKWLARLLTTGFRNIALALPFSMVVLGRTDVSVYIVVYALVAMVTCYLAVALVRLVNS